MNYTGQRLDSTGLLFYNARYYDPQIGKFISSDTIVPNAANPQTYNRYGYAYNNPLKYTDATGHCPWCIAIGVGFLIGAGISYGSQVIDNLTSGGMSFLDALVTNIDVPKIVTDGVANAIPGGPIIQVAAGQGAQIVDNVIHDREWNEGILNPVEMAIDALPLPGPIGKKVEDVCSFSAETEVATATGEEQISELQANDLVLAYDEGLDSNGHYRVQATFSHVDPEILLLQLEGEEIETTPEHPFYTKEQV
jgi:RHS repeat-associated protein